MRDLCLVILVLFDDVDVEIVLVDDLALVVSCSQETWGNLMVVEHGAHDAVIPNTVPELFHGVLCKAVVVCLGGDGFGFNLDFLIDWRQLVEFYLA